MALRFALQARHPQHVVLPLGPAFTRDTIDSGEEVDVLLHREIVVQRKLLRHVADVALDVFGLGFNVEAGHRACAFRRLQKSAEDPDGRGLPCPVRSQESEDLAAMHIQCDVIDGHEVPEALDQLAGLHRDPIGLRHPPTPVSGSAR